MFDIIKKIIGIVFVIILLLFKSLVNTVTE